MAGKKSSVFGVGINDSNYVTNKKETINGKRAMVWQCPFYVCWSSMLRRCYSKVYQKKQPTYAGCTVCNEWLTFSNFKAWMEQQDWEGKHLDKDILFAGNKVYSPETCVFVSRSLNAFIFDASSYRGAYKLGVDFVKSAGKLAARCCNPFTKKVDFLGYFKSEDEAHLAWKARKHELAVLLCREINDQRVRSAILSRYE